MKIDTTGFTDKASKDPEQMQIYIDSDDYIDAYSRHTDWRVEKVGPAMAIGGDWEDHGPLQLRFLHDKGMRPESKLLDFGCGTGRFSRHAVPWLDKGNYTGMDISLLALDHAKKLSHTEGWIKRLPVFILGAGSFGPVIHVPFDYVWMHSVFTHLPAELIVNLLTELNEMQFGEFYFTYKKRDYPQRTGLKQFGYPFTFFENVAHQVGLAANPLELKWPQGQSCGVIRRG